MPRAKRTRKKPAEEQTHLAIRLTAHEARIDATINYDVYAPQLAIRLNEDDPLFVFRTILTITGTAIWPEKRQGEIFELTIYGDDAPSSEVNLRLRDVHARTKSGAQQYRQYRGREVPVFDPPKGIGFLDKVRGEPRWQGWITAAPRFISDALVLLGREMPLYIALHEQRYERTRWIRSLALQTTDPADE